MKPKFDAADSENRESVEKRTKTTRIECHTCEANSVAEGVRGSHMVGSLRVEWGKKGNL